MGTMICGNCRKEITTENRECPFCAAAAETEVEYRNPVFLSILFLFLGAIVGVMAAMGMIMWMKG